MAVKSAALLFLLHIVLVFGYKLMDDDENENEIVWPSEYHFSGEKINFATTLKEPFEMWYSSNLNRSRIDFYGGSSKKFYEGDEDIMFLIFTRAAKNLTLIPTCWKNFMDVAQVDLLPDVSSLTYTGQTLNIFDKVVDVWTGKEDYREIMVKETTLYVYKTDEGYDIPVQLTERVIQEEIGEVRSHTVTNFYNFRDSVSEEELTVPDPDLCTHYYGEDFIVGTDFRKDIQVLHPNVPGELDVAFDSYINYHGKSYHENERDLRKTIFEQNWRMVHEHNQQDHGYKMELNEFSDKTDAELKYLTGMLVHDHPWESTLAFPHSLEEIDEIAKDLPENFDLRLEGAVTKVKHQGECGSCWAFATTAGLEGAYARAYGGRLLDFSEQSLVDCGWSYGNYGCDGGFLDTAWKYVLDHGMPTERDYGGYTATNGDCKVPNMTTVYHIKGFSNVTVQNANAMKVALYKYGPVTVGIYCTRHIMHYSSGLFYDFACSRRTHRYVNHAVVVVGYGKRDGEDYWLVKNSWGESWGEDGYILMSAKNNNCFVLDFAVYPIV